MAKEADDRNTAGKRKGSEANAHDDLKPCDKPHTAEAMRNEQEDDACDDGVR